MNEDMRKKQADHSKRHCMVVHAYYPLGETRVEREGLALLDHGIEVDVICLKDIKEPSFEIIDGIQIHRLPVRRHKGSGLVVQLLEYLSFFMMTFIYLTIQHLRKGYDVVQIHNLPDFLVFVALIPKLTGTKVILDLHDLMPEFYAERFQKSMDSLPVRMVLLQQILSCRFADHIVTVTEPWRQLLIKQGIPAKKCSVVMNLADPRIFQPLATENRPAEEKDRFRLIYHGYIPQRYGLDLVLQALDRTRNKIPGIHFTLIGNGEYLDTLKEMAHDLGLSKEHVKFIASMPAHKLPALIAKADLGVVPYRNDVFTDALLPTKLMEYALMGVPTIAASTTAISSYFDETMVQFFNPGNLEELVQSILELHADRDRLAQLGKGIQKFNQDYSWENLSKDYVNLVETLGR